MFLRDVSTDLANVLSCWPAGRHWGYLLGIASPGQRIRLARRFQQRSTARLDCRSGPIPCGSGPDRRSAREASLGSRGTRRAGLRQTDRGSEHRARPAGRAGVRGAGPSVRALRAKGQGSPWRHSRRWPPDTRSAIIDTARRRSRDNRSNLSRSRRAASSSPRSSSRRTFQRGDPAAWRATPERGNLGRDADRCVKHTASAAAAPSRASGSPCRTRRSRHRSPWQVGNAGLSAAPDKFH